MPTSLPPEFLPAYLDPELFRIEMQAEPPGIRVLLYGEVDLSTVDLIREAMEQVTAEPVPLVILDLGGVTFFAVCGLRALVSAHNIVESGGGRLQIREVPSWARRLISLSRLDLVLDVT